MFRLHFSLFAKCGNQLIYSQDTLGQLYALLFSLIQLLCGRTRLFNDPLSREELTGIEKPMLGNLIKLGLPMAIKFASVMTSKLFVNAFINSYGVAVSAFSGIAHKLSSMTNMMSNAFNTAGSTMVGQNIGAGRFERVGKVMKSIFSITVSIDIVLSALMILFPEQIYGLFTTDAEVISIG